MTIRVLPTIKRFFESTGRRHVRLRQVTPRGPGAAQDFMIHDATWQRRFYGR